MPLPHLVVSVICIKDNSVLMVHEKDNGIICWNQPAGHVELNESITEAAKREALEETGYEVELTGIQGIYQNIHSGNGTHYVRVSFFAEAKHRVTQTLDNDILSADWLDIDDILDGKYTLRSALTRQCLEECRNAPIYPISIIHQFENGVPQ